MTTENYTVFCRAIGCRDNTIWIGTVTATSRKEAMQFAVENCAGDWDCEAADVAAIGVAAGDVAILAWMDEGYSYGELTTAGFEV